METTTDTRTDLLGLSREHLAEALSYRALADEIQSAT